MHELVEKITALQMHIRRQEQIRKRLEQLTEEERRIEEQIGRQEEVLRQEGQDVAQLESLTVRALFHRVLGDIHQQLEIERQAYLRAYMSIVALERELEALQYERSVLIERKTDLQGLESELKLLLRQKESALKKTDDRIARKLFEFDQHIGQQKWAQRQIEEAIDAGQKSLKMLDDLIRGMTQVKSEWGFRKLKGRGRYASYSKKNYIDNAHQELGKVQFLLSRFAKEVNDVYPETQPTFALQQIEVFLETFLHDLITDWIVQRRISSALHDLESCHARVQLLLYNLNYDLNQSAHAIQLLNDEKRLYVENL